MSNQPRVTEPSPRLNKRALFEVVGYDPHPGQIQVHRSKALRRVVACGVRWGKTVCAAMEGIAGAMAPAKSSVGWVVAPTYDLANKVFREIATRLVERVRHRVVKVREHEHSIIVRNLGDGLSEIRGKSAENPTSLLGEGLDWLIVDEAARLRPHIWSAHLSQRLIDKRGWAMLISTPKGKGWFYDAWRRGRPGGDADWLSLNLPSWSNPHLDRTMIESERSRIPDRVFRQEYGAEFMEGAGAVFRSVRESATGEWMEPVKRDGVWSSYFIGLDLAKVEDYTVAVIIDQHTKAVVAVDRFHRVDWSTQVMRVKALAERYSPASLLVDSTGAGEPIYEALCAEGLDVQPYQFTAKSKSALIDNLALMLEKRELVLPKPELWPEGIDELEAFEYSVTDQGGVRTGAPGGMHDDCVIALALAAWNLSNQTTPGIYFRRA